MSEEPRSITDVDQALHSALHEAHRFRWLLVFTVTLLLVAAVVVLWIFLLQARSEVQASCRFWRAISPLPVTSITPGHPPTRLSVTLIAGSRSAYTGQHCPGQLLPADPSLIRWAGYYGVPLPG